MSDLHEQAEELRDKTSDTSLMNFMTNHKVSVHYSGKSWVATTEDYMGQGNSLRSSIIDLKRRMYD